MTKYLSGNETTRRERLLDAITVRSAFDTPLLSRLPHESTSHIITEWSMDEPFQSSEGVRSLSAPHGDARLEASDYTYRTPYYPVRAKAIAEIKHHGMEMSGSDRSAIVAGMDGTWDYRVGQLFTKHINSIDNTLLYGLGAGETSGASTARNMQGLISWAAFTGQERLHGTATQVDDPYGTTIPSSMFSAFYNANHDPVTLDSFYGNLIAPLLRAGGNMDDPWVFQCGYRTMQRVARFLIADGGVLLNERERSADDAMGSDYLNVFRLASGHVVSFRTNRWLDDPTSTFAIDNTTGTNAGSQTITYQGDQTIIGYEPGTVKVLWYREPGFENVATTGDYSRIACKSEVTLQVSHPLCVAGMGNCLA